jgi:hypothetical protein
VIIERNKINLTAVAVLAEQPNLTRDELATAVAERLGLPPHLVADALPEAQEPPQ